MIIVDENIDESLIAKMREHNWKLFSIREQAPGISDHEVIEKVKAYKGTLLTEDKDFGELVFAHGQAYSGIAVIFLKSDKMTYQQIEETILQVVKQYSESQSNYFITIDKNKVRVISL